MFDAEEGKLLWLEPIDLVVLIPEVLVKLPFRLVADVPV